MKLNEYQEQALKTAFYPDCGTGSERALSYTLLKLNGKAGECTELFGKSLRDGDDGELAMKMEKKLGDVLWYISAIANELGISLNDVADTNLAKLADRTSRNTLSGSGDDR